jgi:hypothetical protein
VAGTGLLAGQGLAHHWAPPAAVLPLALSIVAGALLIEYARRLSRSSGRGRELAALAHLADRDELAARLRSASKVLSDVAAELRTGPGTSER